MTTSNTLSAETLQDGFDETIAREAMRLAIHKLPMKARFIKREGDN